MIAAWIKGIPAIIAAGFSITPGLEATIWRQNSSHTDGEEILVVASRLLDTKVDYKLKRNKVIYCGPRDREQNINSVYEICRHIEDCVFDGEIAKAQLYKCVSLKISRKSN